MEERRTEKDGEERPTAEERTVQAEEEWKGREEREDQKKDVWSDHGTRAQPQNSAHRLILKRGTRKKQRSVGKERNNLQRDDRGGRDKRALVCLSVFLSPVGAAHLDNRRRNTGSSGTHGTPPRVFCGEADTLGFQTLPQ